MIMNAISPASAIAESSKKTRSGASQSELKSKTMVSGMKDENGVAKKCVLTLKSRAAVSPSNHSSTHSPSNTKQSNSAFNLRLSFSGEKAEKVRAKFNQCLDRK